MARAGRSARSTLQQLARSSLPARIVRIVRVLDGVVAPLDGSSARMSSKGCSDSVLSQPGLRDCEQGQHVAPTLLDGSSQSAVPRHPHAAQQPHVPVPSSTSPDRWHCPSTMFAMSLSSQTSSFPGRWGSPHTMFSTPAVVVILNPHCDGGRRAFSAAKVSGSDVKVGNIIEKKGRMFEVIKTQHTQQGRGGATIQAELRDVQSGLKSTEKLRTAESIDVVFVDAKPFSFLYSEGDTAHLMDPNTYEQQGIPMKFFGETASLLKEGMQVTVKYFNGEPLMAHLPSRVTARVVEAEPHVKGNTATASTKKVTLEGGLKVQAPPFVVEGDDVVVDTATLSYVTRA